MENKKIGIIEATAKALFPPVNLTLTGIASFLLKTKAKINSLHEKIKQKSPVTAIPGKAKGIAIFIKISNLLQPSTRAASSI